LKTLKTSEAATMLNVCPNTLRVWERRFGFPEPQRSPGKHRVYAHGEIVALRDALEDGLTISSAVSVARDTFGAELQALFTRLCEFSADEADRVMERTLAMRSIERSVEDVLIPALRRIHTRKGLGSAASVFAMQWACDWLVRVRRATAPTGHRGSLLIGDASAPPLDPMASYTMALELFCVRAGMRTLTLPLSASLRLSEAVTALSPDAIVIAGWRELNRDLLRWISEVRTQAGPVPVMLYHYEEGRPTPHSRIQTLPSSPSEARSQILAAIVVADAPSASAREDGGRSVERVA
jgi:DNA-binding transcriptional MerR regulator